MTRSRPVQNPPLRAVFLDIGETVMRPNPSWEHVYAMAFEEYGVQIQIPELEQALRKAYRHGGWGMEGGFEPSPETSFRRTVELDQAAIAELGIGPMPEAFFRRLNELFMVTSHWHIFPEAYPTLVGLQERGLIVGAVSNWVWNLPELLHALDLVQHFDFIAASARIGFEKPHRRIFEWALRKARVPAASVIHVGDHLDADVAGARAVGITPVLIDRYGRHRPEDLPPGLDLITALDQLLPIVDAKLTRAKAAS
jgi:putative hydrolase of the HAD superfamily